MPLYIKWTKRISYTVWEENVRGMNKRGWIYESNCTDDPVHLEETKSLYGAHNFILVSGKKQFGLFLDTPGKVVFDIGYTNSSQLKIILEDGDYELYLIDGGTPDDIITWFRELIGSSYLPPKWAFGFGQSPVELCIFEGGKAGCRPVPGKPYSPGQHLP